MFDGRKLSELSLADIQSLPPDEGLFLEHKQQIDGAEHLCKSISAFANAQGGILVVGVNDTTGNWEGFQSTESVDKLKTKWLQYLDRLNPKLPTPEIVVFQLTSGRLLGVIRVSASPYAPHWVRNYGSTQSKKKRASDYGHQFFRRVGSRSRSMDYYSVKEAFVAAAERTRILREFRDRRAGMYESGSSPIQVYAPAALCLMVPPRSLTEFLNRDLETICAGEDGRTDVSYWPLEFDPFDGRPDFAWNHDGLAFSCRIDPGHKRRVYVQHFHTGAIEFTKQVTDYGKGGPDRINRSFWSGIVAACKQYADVVKRTTGDTTFFFMCSLLRMSQVYREGTEIFGQSRFDFPEVLVRSVDTLEEDLDLVKSMMAHTTGATKNRLH